MYGTRTGFDNQGTSYNTCNKHVVTKSEVMSILQQYCYAQTGVQVTKIERIDTAPSSVKHACINGGIQFLPQYIYNLPTDYEVIQVKYYFCTHCGKLFVYNDFL